jgi:hypothetical protein
MSQQPSFSKQWAITFILPLLGFGLGGYLGYQYSQGLLGILTGALFGALTVSSAAVLLFPKAVLASYGGSKVVLRSTIFTVYVIEFLLIVFAYWSRISNQSYLQQQSPLWFLSYLILSIWQILTAIAFTRSSQLRKGKFG